MTPRLLIVTSCGQVSGAERVLLDVVDAATSAGWTVMCAAPSGAIVKQLRIRGVDVLVVPELAGAHRRGPTALPGRLVRWCRAAALVRRAAERADVVLVNSHGALPVIRLARVAPPVAWLAHDVLVRPDRRGAYRLCRSALARVFAVSDAVKQALPGHTPAVEVVHNGVRWPVEPAATQREVGSPSVIGVSALLTPWKGHGVVLDSVPLMPESIVVEFMGGHLDTDADYAVALQKQVAEAGLSHRVRFLGHVTAPLERMRGWTVAVSASVLPEACPLNVLEAMSLGLPVVATDHGGAPEVLAGAGLLVPPRDAAALADAVSLLVRDDELRKRCAAAGRRRVAELHRRDRQTAELLERLAGVARGSGGRS